ncbi:hypothetical protein CfE428DRAFT_0521 [Chthoniobacter flavus Ellin428]|uniref:Uncharacterized protein n=1 Tax=Chthoniobacter flavus Ellin428 TaxID=497964 RepID=B4CV08_9BACT|nr:hypothetical protein [Chthoniobacter flavus]EDY22396.1 hypothetical protein CfE428DRAFT_0521 [Chthoniobacter flavus Ellin428]TCO94591.1 hypothetical protein EV701_10258 [Chthoniobacter flavus]
MTFTRRIPADRLLDFDVREGDTLRVIATSGSAFVVQVSRAEEGSLHRKSTATEWLRHAKGSVRLETGETANDVRMEYYAAKYGLAQ